MGTNHSRLTRLTTAPRSQSGHYFRASFRRTMGDGFMRVLGFAFLIVWPFASAPMTITVADTVQVPDTTQSPVQPAPDVEQDLLNLED